MRTVLSKKYHVSKAGTMFFFNHTSGDNLKPGAFILTE
jgi:hypothetical protein